MIDVFTPYIIFVLTQGHIGKEALWRVLMRTHIIERFQV